MAEAEDVITDAARHATVFTRSLWRRYRPPPPGPVFVTLTDVAARIDMLLAAVFPVRHSIRISQPPPHATLLGGLFGRDQRPRCEQAVPATDGRSIWLPRTADTEDRTLGANWYRTAALQQAMRAERGSANPAYATAPPLQRDVYLILEAFAADEALAILLPGVRASLDAVRAHALAQRPALDSFSTARQPLERFLRRHLVSPCGQPPEDLVIPATPSEAFVLAGEIAAALVPDHRSARRLGEMPLVKDIWTGELKHEQGRRGEEGEVLAGPDEEPDYDPAPPRSARMTRAPSVREAKQDEDDDNGPGPWMVQPEHGHEHAEDPMGLQRPIDRDEATSAAEFGELLSELPHARLVSTPGRPKEVLLSDDPPETRARTASRNAGSSSARIRYPEWDWRAGAYRDPGSTVHRIAPVAGSQDWVDRTLSDHRSMLATIRRRFEMLRAEPVVLRRRVDGEEIDLEAYLDDHADRRAGLPRSDALYQTRRPARRSMAIMLLVDVSGSTDGWIAGNRRIIDVEREALLLVSIALDGMGEPFAIQAFSGEGPQAVTVRELKSFDEPYNDEIARRIGALEPEHYTRAGAAIRHATALLMRQSASHRLLLLLSDGKPNDVDEYEGRYGVEDMRQAVNEAGLQGIFPFCLTIDSRAATYLPRVFGASRYGLLPEPRLLPSVLLEWMKRLLRQ